MIQLQLLQTIEKQYSLAISATEPLSGGEYKEMHRLLTDRGVLVLAIRHHTTQPESMPFEHGLLQYLHRQIPQIAAPVPTLDGRTFSWHNSRIVTLHPCLPGTTLESPNEAQRLTAARMLARIHLCGVAFPTQSARPGLPGLLDLDWESNFMWEWEPIQRLLHGDCPTAARARFLSAGDAAQEILHRDAQIEVEFAHFRGWSGALARVRSQLTVAPIHGDYYARNLLAGGDEISGVVDWDECRLDCLVFELSRAVWEFCANDTLNVNSALVFLEAYKREGSPLTDEEYRLIIPMMRCSRLMDFLSGIHGALNGERWSEEDAEYHLANLQALETLHDSERILFRQLEPLTRAASSKNELDLDDTYAVRVAGAKRGSELVGGTSGSAGATNTDS